MAQISLLAYCQCTTYSTNTMELFHYESYIKLSCTMLSDINLSYTGLSDAKLDLY